MHSRPKRRGSSIAARLVVALAIVGVVGYFSTSVVGVSASSRLDRSPAIGFTNNVRVDRAEGTATGQNEPQVMVDQTGRTYVDWQSSPKGVAASSTMDGRHFTYLGNPDNATKEVGDVAWAGTTWPRVGRATPGGPKGANGVFFGTLGTGTCGAIEIRESTTVDSGGHWAPTDASWHRSTVTGSPPTHPSSTEGKTAPRRTLGSMLSTTTSARP